MCLEADLKAPCCTVFAAWSTVFHDTADSRNGLMFGFLEK